MNRITILLASLFVLSLLLFGCGHLDGNNPLGVTGGGADGYGSAGTTVGGGGGGSQVDQMLFGTWRTDYSANDFEILVIGSGYYQWYDYSGSNLDDSGIGTWYSNGGIIYATEGGNQDEYPYTVSANSLSINWGGGPTTYYRYNP